MNENFCTSILIAIFVFTFLNFLHLLGFRFLSYDDMIIFIERSEIAITTINNIHYVSYLKMAVIFKFFM